MTSLIEGDDQDSRCGQSSGQGLVTPTVFADAMEDQQPGMRLFDRIERADEQPNPIGCLVYARSARRRRDLFPLGFLFEKSPGETAVEDEESAR